MKRILIVEDDTGIAQLIQLELEESGYETLWADTFQQADDILESQTINLMVVDFKLSADANAHDWIRNRKSKKLLLPPFIISTGQGDERIAVEMMKMGARDYLLKDSMLISRLTNIIKRVLKEIEQDEKIALSKRVLQENEIRYRMLFEKNPEPMFITDSETFRFLEVNDAAVRHYGYSKHEFLSMTFMDIRPKEDIELMHKNIAHFLKKKLTKAYVRHLKKNGELMHVELTLVSINWNDKKATHVLVNDITGKVKTQEKLQNKRFLLRKILDESTFFIQAQSGIINFNKITDTMVEISGARVAAFQRFGNEFKEYNIKGFSGLGDFAMNSSRILGFNLRDKAWESNLSLVESIQKGDFIHIEKLHEIENKLLSKTIVSIVSDAFNVSSVSLVPVKYQEVLLGVFTLIFDQNYPESKLINPEVIEIFAKQVSQYIIRVQTDRALLRKQQEYQNLFELNPQAMMIFDSESLRCLDVNVAALNLYGYSKDEFLQLSIMDLRSAEEIPALIDSYKEFRSDLPTKTTTVHQTKTNERYQVELSASIIEFKNRKARHVLVNKYTKLEE